MMRRSWRQGAGLGRIFGQAVFLYALAEQQADFFAACILMPRVLVMNYLVSIGKSLETISGDDEVTISMSNEFDVSLEAVKARIRELRQGL